MLSPVNILIVTILSGMVSMAVLGSLRAAAIPGVASWIGANALAIVALVLFALQGHAPMLMTIVGANGLFAAVHLVALQGCQKFFNRNPVVRAEYVACLALLVVIAYETYVSPNIDARIAVVSAFHAYIYGSIGWLCHEARPADRPKYNYRFLTVAAFLGALGHAFRGCVYGAGWVHQTTLLQAAPANVTFLGLGILALPCLSIGMVMLAHDRMAERLERMANIDELTGVLARRAFLARAQAVLKASAQSRERLSIAIIDIDHFKAINDKYGHAGGDRVLAHFASVVSKALRTSDVFGRLGGEEFAILCPSTGCADAVLLLDSIRITVGTCPCHIDTEELTYTFSVGVDEYRDGDGVALLMARADAALYSAKAMGRNCVVAALSSSDEQAGDAREHAGGRPSRWSVSG